MRIRYLALVIGIIVTLGAAFIAATLTFPEQTCRVRGGEYFRAGFVGYGCYFKATDAGKECTDSNQCQGRCEGKIIPPGEIEEGAVTLPAVYPKGTCSKYTNNPFGCYTELKNGKADKIACVD